jgi:hypothetical protein
MSDDTIYSDDRLAASALLSLASDATAFDPEDTPILKTLCQIENESDSEEDEASDDGEDDTMTDVDDARGGECGFCGSPVEADEDMLPRRFFRCTPCNSGLQCESCCVDAHVTHPSHLLEVSEYL